MNPERSATSFGNTNPTGVDLSVLNGASMPSREALTELHSSTERADQRQLLNREHPFGVTFIIGGTNVRFCLSIPKQEPNDQPSEPLKDTWQWQKLHDHIKPQLEASGIPFSASHDLIYPLLAQQFANFVASQFDPNDGPPPFDKIAACDFSIAGLVTGTGFNAEVSTTNTGLNFAKEHIARKLFDSIQKELTSRGWPNLVERDPQVLNDAAAGTKGETIIGGLQQLKDGLFVILGTGVGSMGWTNGAFDNKFAELGHRIVKEVYSADRLEKPTTRVNLFKLLDDQEFHGLIESDGSYTNLKGTRRYAENFLAGPWLAVRFLKKELGDSEDLLSALAHKIAPKYQQPAADLFGDLTELADLQTKSLTQWAVNSNSRLVRAVNDFILNFDAWNFVKAAPCRGPVDAAVSLEKQLVTAGFSTWKTYWKDVGEFLSAAYDGMKAEGNPPQKIVLGGGIGEAYNVFPAPLREAALHIIHESGRLPVGTVEFSKVSAEQRESAMTADSVEKAMEHYRDNLALPTASHQTVSPAPSSTPNNRAAGTTSQQHTA